MDYRRTTEQARSSNTALLRQRTGVPDSEKQKLLQVKQEENTLLTTADLVRDTALTRTLELFPLRWTHFNFNVSLWGYRFRR
jgi:hypothetical protein